MTGTDRPAPTLKLGNKIDKENAHPLETQSAILLFGVIQKAALHQKRTSGTRPRIKKMGTVCMGLVGPLNAISAARACANRTNPTTPPRTVTKEATRRVLILILGFWPDLRDLPRSVAAGARVWLGLPSSAGNITKCLLFFPAKKVKRGSYHDETKTSGHIKGAGRPFRCTECNIDDHHERADSSENER